jgi:hypothetical protein
VIRGLFINIVKPAKIPEGMKLPVLFVRSQTLISITESNITSSGSTAVCISQLHQYDLLSSVTRIIFCLGAFSAGDTSTYPGNSIVARSIALDEPVIYVSANYRLNGMISSSMVMARLH